MLFDIDDTLVDGNGQFAVRRIGSFDDFWMQGDEDGAVVVEVYGLSLQRDEFG